MAVDGMERIYLAGITLFEDEGDVLQVSDGSLSPALRKPEPESPLNRHFARGATQGGLRYAS
jgi:hypothetical protein